MPRDLMIVDDEECIRKLMERFSQIDGLNYITFDSGLKAREFIYNCSYDELPRAYLVDMKTTNDFTDKEELASPLELFTLLDGIGQITRDANGTSTNFVYFTGNVSEHDEHVREMTKAPVYSKTGDLNLIRAFIKILAR